VKKAFSEARNQKFCSPRGLKTPLIFFTPLFLASLKLREKSVFGSTFFKGGFSKSFFFKSKLYNE